MSFLSHTPGEIKKIEASASRQIAIAPTPIDPDGKGYVATCSIQEGSLVIQAYGEIIGHQTGRHSIQHSKEVHIYPGEWGGKYLNHSCEGNLYVRSDERGIARFFAARQIDRGQELTYPYYMTELTWSYRAYERNQPCHCNSPNCRGRIRSFDMLDNDEISLLVHKGTLSAYLIAWYQEQSF